MSNETVENIADIEHLSVMELMDETKKTLASIEEQLSICLVSGTDSDGTEDTRETSDIREALLGHFARLTSLSTRIRL